MNIPDLEQLIQDIEDGARESTVFFNTEGTYNIECLMNPRRALHGVEVEKKKLRRQK